MAQPVDTTRRISGNFVYVYDENGNWLADVTAFEANAEGTYEDVPRSGTRSIGKKLTTIDRTGTMTTMKVSSRFSSIVKQALSNTGATTVTELNVKLDDPDNGGVERWRIKNVQFVNLPIVSAEVGSLLEQEFQFVFEDEELVEEISN